MRSRYIPEKDSHIMIGNAIQEQAIKNEWDKEENEQDKIVLDKEEWA